MRLFRFFAVLFFASALSAACFQAAQAAGQKAAPERALKGVWRIEAIEGKPAVAGMRGALPQIEFGAGHFSGQSGCNGFGGALETKGDKVKFSRPAATLMACPQPLMKQEASLYRALGKARAYRYAASRRGAKAGEGKEAKAKTRLLLRDGKGRVIVEMTQK